MLNTTLAYVRAFTCHRWSMLKHHQQVGSAGHIGLTDLAFASDAAAAAEAYSQAQASGSAEAFSQALARANAGNAQACLGSATSSALASATSTATARWGQAPSSQSIMIGAL